MKRTTFILSILCLMANMAFASNEPVPDRPTGMILGTVADQVSNEPVAFATIALFNTNDTTHVIKGVVTDGQGKFVINGIPMGNYDVKITYVGYNPVVIKDVTLNRGQREVVLPKTTLSENIAAINEVQIVQERLKGEDRIDKTIFTINDQVRNSSTSGLDLLKHIPAVSVDFQENVTLEGKSDILFYVDGIERNKDFVAQLDPKLIDKVEIITNPGVKYSADISGVINIVLVKEPRVGINGSLKMDVPHPTIVLFNPRGNLEYGTQHFRTFVGYRLHLEKFNVQTLLQKSMNDAENPYYVEIKGDGENMWNNGSGNFGFDWFINETSSLNFYSELRHHNSREKGFSFNESIYMENQLTDYQVNNKSSINGGLSTFYSLFYKKKLNDKGNELTVEANYYDYDGGQESDFNYTEYDPANINLLLNNTSFTEDVDNNRSNGELKADYTYVSGKIKQEIGYRGYYQWMKNEKNLSNHNGTENFEYNEIRNTGYYSLTGNVKKITLQGGIRYENSIFQIPGEENINFDILLPQFKVSYKINDAQNLKISYRKQVYRPNIQDLNPFELFIDSTLVRRGNPEMKPAIDNKTELSYSLNFKNNYISPSAYFTYTKNGISEYSRVENNITVISQANILDRYEYGLSVNGAAQIFKFMRLNFYGAGFNRAIENDGLKNEKISWRTHLTGIYMLPKEFVAFTMFNYNSPNIGYQREYRRGLLFIVGVEKPLWKKAKISAFYNPFIKDFMYSQVSTVYGNTTEDWEGNLDIRNVFAIEFTYTFNYGKKIHKINRSTEYDKDGGGGMF
jgi:hypothetical protein